MTTWQHTAPNRPDKWDKEAAANERHLIWGVVREATLVDDQYKPGERTRQVIIDLVDFDAGEIHRGYPAMGNFGRVFDVGEGNYVAGRVHFGKKTPGRNAPYQLDPELTADELTRVNSWLDAHATQTGDGVLIAETAGFENDAEPF